MTGAKSFANCYLRKSLMLSCHNPSDVFRPAIDYCHCTTAVLRTAAYAGCGPMPVGVQPMGDLAVTPAQIRLEDDWGSYVG